MARTAGPMTSDPITIPTHFISPTTPPPGKHAADDAVMRPRSDTICTTSSSATDPSFQLQTPQTPSILHVLGDNDVFSTSPDASSGRPRKDSYGFRLGNDALEAHPTPLSHPVAGGLSGLELAAYTPENEREETEVEGILDEHTERQPLRESPFLPTIPRHSGTEFSRPRGSIASAVRRKLERPRSSFKSLKGSSRPDSPALSDGGSTDAERDERPRKHRLRTLLRSISHTGSTVSLRSLISVDSHQVGAMDPSSVPMAQNASEERPIPPVLDDGVISRDYIHEPATFPSHLGSAVQIDDDMISHAVVIPSRPKGKERARSMLRHRPSLLPTLSTIPSHHTSRPPISPIISRPRAMSMPYVSVSKVETVVQADLFGSMLPRELQVMIFRTLVQTWDTPRRDGRWENEEAGRRMLIGLSRVS